MENEKTQIQLKISDQDITGTEKSNSFRIKVTPTETDLQDQDNLVSGGDETKLADYFLQNKANKSPKQEQQLLQLPKKQNNKPANGQVKDKKDQQQTVQIDEVITEPSTLSNQQISQLQKLLELPHVISLITPKPVLEVYEEEIDIPQPTPAQLPFDFQFLTQSNKKMIREEVISYIAQQVLAKESRSDIAQKFDAFKIESASRKTLRELIGSFDAQTKETIQRTTALENKMKTVIMNLEKITIMSKKIEKDIETVMDMDQQLKKLKAEVIENYTTSERKFDGVHSKMDHQKQNLEVKIDAIRTLEVLVNKTQAEMTKTTKLTMDTKQELFSNHSQLRSEFMTTKRELEQTEKKFNEALMDNTYWLSQYKRDFVEQEKFLSNYKVKLEADYETMMYELSKRVSNSDMKLNFQALNDMLFLKFGQLEDIKQCLRDVVVFQKYFYPLQTQVLITQNLELLEAAQLDENFNEIQKIAYDNALAKLENLRDEAIKLPDLEYKQHVEDLTKHHLKESQWLLKPLINPENNFVDDLLVRYVDDLHQRNKFDTRDFKTVANTIRRVVKLKSMHDLIQENYMESIGWRQRIKEKEEQIRIKKKKIQLQKKCAEHIKNKFQVSKKLVFKRQNSFNMTLTPIGDIGDQERIESENKKMRLSINIPRGRTLRTIQDVTAGRITMTAEQDIDSEENWSDNQKTKDLKPTKNRKRKQKNEINNESSQNDSSESSSQQDLLELNESEQQQEIEVSEQEQEQEVIKVQSESEQSEGIVEVQLPPAPAQKQEKKQKKIRVEEIYESQSSSSTVVQQVIVKKPKVQKIQPQSIKPKEKKVIRQSSEQSSNFELNEEIHQPKTEILQIKDKKEDLKPQSNLLIQKPQSSLQIQKPQQIIISKDETPKRVSISIESQKEVQKTKVKIKEPKVVKIEKVETSDSESESPVIVKPIKQKKEKKIKKPRTPSSSSSSSLSTPEIKVPDKKKKLVSIQAPQKTINKQKTLVQSDKKPTNASNELSALAKKSGLIKEPPVYVPMPVDIRRKLFLDIQDEIRPQYQRAIQLNIEKALEPIKRVIAVQAQDVANQTQKTISQMEKMLSDTVNDIDKFKGQVKDFVENEVKLIIGKVSRSKSDGDTRHLKLANDIKEIQDKIAAQSYSFDELAGVISMLIENINMQMEAEMADLIDRRQISLYGGLYTSQNKINKAEVIPTSSEFKNKTFGIRNKSLYLASQTSQLMEINNNERIQSPEPGFKTDQIQLQVQSTIQTPSKGPSLLPSIVSPRIQQNNSELKITQNMIESAQRNDMVETSALQLLQNQNQIPVSVLQSCLTCSKDGHDTQLIMKLFKIACLSYKASDVVYRQHQLGRGALISLRRDLIEKVTQSLVSTKLFKTNLHYPRRYFDDLILEKRKAELQQQNLIEQSPKGIVIDGSQQKLKDLLAQKLPFGAIPQKLSNQQSQSQIQPVQNNRTITQLSQNRGNITPKRSSTNLGQQVESEKVVPDEIRRYNENSELVKKLKKIDTEGTSRNFKVFSPRNEAQSQMESYQKIDFDQIIGESSVVSNQLQNGNNQTREASKSKLQNFKKIAQAPTLTVQKPLGHQLSVPNVEIRNTLLSSDLQPRQ